MKKYKVGYTQGAFDMFHIGHLNLLKNAKAQCDKLIVGVNTDDLIFRYKGKHTVINEADRAEIIRSVRYVDDVILVDTLDKLQTWERLEFDAIFIGDDWKGNERWIETEQVLSQKGAEVVYLTYTRGVSSTMLRGQSNDKISDNSDNKE